MRSEELVKIKSQLPIRKVFTCTQDPTTSGVVKGVFFKVPFKAQVVSVRAYMKDKTGTLTAMYAVLNKYTISAGSVIQFEGDFTQYRNATTVAYTGAGAVIPGVTLAQTASSEILKIAACGTTDGAIIAVTAGADFLTTEGIVSEDQILGITFEKKSGDAYVGTLVWELEFYPV